jgi:hypothetical protein
MLRITRSQRRALVVLAWVVMTTAWFSAGSAQGKDVDASSVAGLPSRAELTAKWWEWVYSLPVSANPLFDETGALADTQQPFKKVFLLVGVINASGTAERTITVPAGTALFFPVINVEVDNVGVVPRQNVPQLRALAGSVIDTVTELHVTLNAASLVDSALRLQSPPFAYHLPAQDNIYQFFGIEVSGTIAPAVSDGYWVYIAPLAPGAYDLNFGGTDTFGGSPFTLDITYHITVE